MTRRICSGSRRTELDVGREAPLDRHLGEEAVVQRERLGDQLMQIGRHRARRRHARELRELVDQALQRFDLADDRRRALVDQRAGPGRRVGEVPAQALGGQLDRRQRILDLVREPPRHLAPRGDLLRPDERRHVVEHQHDAFVRAAVADERRRHGREVKLLPVPLHARFPGRPAEPLARGRAGDQRLERLEIGRVEHRARPAWPTTDAIEAEQARGGAVDHRDRCPTASIDTTPVVIRSRIVSM